METTTLLIVVALVFLTGFLFAPLGLGGGLLFVPILHYVADLEITPSTLLISLALTAMTSFGSGLAHRSEGLWDVSAIRKALGGAIPGAVIGVLIVTLIGKDLNFVFKALAMLLIIWAVTKMIRRIRGLGRKESETKPDDLRLRSGAGLGGMLCAILAMGSGAIYVPAYRTYAGLSHRQAVGSSYATMMVVIPVAFITHAFLLEDAFPPAILLLTLPIAVLLGARTGAKIGMRFSDRTVMVVFCLVLSFVLVRYLIDTYQTLTV